ncbi:DUF4279 domain-containing protein [Serpentinicella alkaliphila]|uniref:Uncharacterized protein DUF4279 n=1 Tax=Serpentinicella alkaliphila TaxID=1734049 RepID=A0A4R2U667_9FIRM|nr:DUF4279 domain-containing protein [Serpentinicella alkaliphila]QUH26493.1 DUF4279 domain-containing protein [Serpentinicella alkaliphila]TCQ03223.1 uncharacterized protein DUF4279 [Serpentinicella alkaliphila]
MSEVKIEFSIIGDDFFPEEITKLLGIQPTEAYCIDDEFLGGSEKSIPMKRKETCWRIETDYAETIDVEFELRKIYNLIKDKADILKMIQNKFCTTCKFVIVIYFSDNPILGIDRDIIKFAAEIDAEFQFDTYI